MSIYTKTGDQGYTSLMNQKKVSKTDNRIELLGCIDELSSQIGLAKVAADSTLNAKLSQVQRTLMTLMAGIADSSNRAYRLEETVVALMEKEIDELENAFPRKHEFVLYGGCELSARLDVARAVCRRTERQLCQVAKYYSVDARAMKYLNRLGDYLYVAARYADYRNENGRTVPDEEEVVARVLKELKKK